MWAVNDFFSDPSFYYMYHQASNPLPKSKEELFIERAVQGNSQLLPDDDEYTSNRNLLKAVIRSGGNITIAKKTFLEDKGFITEIVKINGKQLQYVADKLKEDKDIVEAAIQNNYEAFTFAASSLKKDNAFILKMLSHSGMIFQYLDSNLQDDKKIIKVAMNQLFQLSNESHVNIEALRKTRALILLKKIKQYDSYYFGRTDYESFPYLKECLALKSYLVENIVHACTNETTIKKDILEEAIALKETEHKVEVPANLLSYIFWKHRSELTSGWNSTISFFGAIISKETKALFTQIPTSITKIQNTINQSGNIQDERIGNHDL